eukprot:3074801-Heterocapsa_arctica.AAC.2
MSGTLLSPFTRHGASSNLGTSPRSSRSFTATIGRVTSETTNFSSNSNSCQDRHRTRRAPYTVNGDPVAVAALGASTSGKIGDQLHQAFGQVDIHAPLSIMRSTPASELS